MYVFSPSRAACAATEFARLPVEEQPTVSKPNSLRIRQRHRHHAILEAQRGHAHRIILKVEIRCANPLGQPREPPSVASSRQASAERNLQAPAAAPW